MQMLIGTTNPSKIRYFERLMEGLDVQLVTLVLPAKPREEL